MLMSIAIAATIFNSLDFTRDDILREIQEISNEYQKGWIAGDEKRVMALFTEDARIQPSGLTPKKGLQEITEFWFPKDGSLTKIQKFKLTFIGADIQGDTAAAMYRSELDWSYENGDTRLAKSQKGHEMVTYKRQPSGKWLIWRQTWTDYEIKDVPFPGDILAK